MSDITILYMTDDDDPKAPLRELGIDDADMKEFLEIASAPFRVAYDSPANRRTFNHDTAQRMKTLDVVYAVLLSTMKGVAGGAKHLAASDGIICAGASVDWQSVNRVAELSRTYAELQKRLEATEQKCMSLDRNSIRRRDLQESYEYLDGEIERLDNLLKGVALTDEAP
jgi:hypothetical protein